METNIIKVNVTKQGIPAEFLLFIGMQKSKPNSYLSFDHTQLNANVLSKIFQNVAQFFNIYNIVLLNDYTFSGKPVLIDGKLGLFFSPNLEEKQIADNTNLKPFIIEFEKMFRELPFYTQKNKYCEKYMFINDVIIQFGQEVTSH